LKAARRPHVVDAADFPEGLVLDSGAFIALERRDRLMAAIAKHVAEQRLKAVTSAGVVAEVWRGGERAQVPLAILLRRIKVLDLTHGVAKVLGRLLAEVRTRDPIDAHVALLAHERGWPVLTSDPDDLLAIDSSLLVHAI